MPIDLIILGALFITSLTIILYFGKSTGVASIFALYVGYILFTIFPYLKNITAFGRNEFEESLIKFVFFVFISLLAYIIIRKAVSVVFPWTPIVKFFETFILSIILTGLFVVAGITVGNFSSLISYPLLLKIFVSSNSLFWWLAGGIGGLLLVLRR